jgi:hypothetical protein
MINCSVSTVERRLKEFNLSIHQQFSQLPDRALNQKIQAMLTINEKIGSLLIYI